MLFILFYIFLYCNIDNILNKYYLSNYETTLNNEFIKNNEKFYDSVININLFVFCTYSCFILKHLYYKSTNKYALALALVYLKYTLNIILDNNMRLCEYEFSRNIMWVFSTPLMLQIYCDINNITLLDINAQYHIIPIIVHIFMYPHKYTNVYYCFMGISYFLYFLFMKTLYKNKMFLFTNIYLNIWTIFMSITVLEMCGIINSYNINLYYLIADVISKISTNIVVHDYYEKELNTIHNMDLQTVNFVSYIMQHIKCYCKDTSIITKNCNIFIENIKLQLSKSPKNTDFLKKELLEKILPLGFDTEYIEKYIFGNNNGAKQFNMLCILFTDIVNYTELAKQYDDKIVFQLLNRVYNTFDNIIKKYAHLQKVETIGDAYMVVGDIYRNTHNHKIVIKEIILLALDFINEIKLIKTPNKIPLSIRIGINMGNVSIGILGNEIPRLCVVGNSVNIASRLQSTAEENTIQVSRHVYEHLQEIDFDVDLEIIKKEDIFLKNIGSVTTYTIHPSISCNNLNIYEESS